MQLANARWRAILVSAVLTFLLSVFFLFHLAQNAFFAFAAAGALFILITASPRFADYAVVAIAALLLAAVYRFLGAGLGSFLGAGPADALAFAGLATILLFGWKAIHKRDDMGRLMAGAILPIFAAISAIVLGALASVRTSVYDLYLYRFDGSFGGQASAVVARWFHTEPVLHDVCAMAYQALPLMLVLVIAVQLNQRRRFPMFPVMVFGLAGLEAPLLYQFLPAVGPQHVFGPQFTSQAHQALAITTVLPMHEAPANSIPSLHFAWAMLALWNMPRKNRAAVAAAALFLPVITLATLGLGEHYAIDLVIAVPFALCVQSTCLGRWRPAILSGVITLSWLCYLRFLLPHFEPTARLAWTASLITIVAPCWVVRRRYTPVTKPVSEEVLVYTQAAV